MKHKFYRKVLKNGMTIIFEKRNLPIVAVAFAVRCGGINEQMSEKGISHFIEHMLYKGTPKRNALQIAEELEKRGGEMNGFTGDTITAFWCKIPSKHLNVALDVLSDMIKNPLFDEKELEKEREVIFEEIKMIKDTPHFHVLSEVQGELYTGTLGMNLAGTYKTMKSIDRDKIVNKFNQTYQPNNLILAVVGDANFEDIVKFSEDNFGSKKGRVSLAKFSKTNKIKIEKRKGIDQANLVFAYHVPFSGKGKYSAEVLSTLMTGGMSSRLLQEIREKRNLAYSVKGGPDITKFFGYNFVYVGTKKESVSVVKNIILDEFEKVAKDLSEKELAQVKEQLIGNYHIEMEDSKNQLHGLLSCEIDGDAKEFYEYENNINLVKLKDVKQLASKVKRKSYSFFALVPE